METRKQKNKMHNTKSDPNENKKITDDKSYPQTNKNLTKCHRSSSLNDLSNSGNSSSLFETTMLSQRNDSLEECQSFQDLKIELETMKNELLAATQKIYNLEMVNQSLQNELTNQKSTLNHYKKMNFCLTPTTVDNRKRKRQRIYDMDRIGDLDQNSSQGSQCLFSTPMSQVADHAEIIGSPHTQVESQEHEIMENLLEQIIDTSSNKPENSVLKEPPRMEEEQKPRKTLSDRERFLNYSTPPNTKKVLVLGDEKARNTRNILQKLLGSEYTVRSICKPGAQLHNVINCTESEVKNFTRDDFIILAGGSNDTNPFDFQSNLNAWLKTVTHTNVIVTEIPMNRNLNEKKLNYDMRFICSRYSNVTFVDMDFSRNIPSRKYFALTLSRSILKEILHVNYKMNYMNYINNQYKNINSNNNTKVYVNKHTQTEAPLAECSGIGRADCKDNLDNEIVVESNDIIQDNINGEHNLFRV